jgi:hypothetical protein
MIGCSNSFLSFAPLGIERKPFSSNSHDDFRVEVPKDIVLPHTGRTPAELHDCYYDYFMISGISRKAKVIMCLGQYRWIWLRKVGGVGLEPNQGKNPIYTLDY